MNSTQHDPISDFFTSEWAAEHPLSSDFSTTVLQKITVNRHKEWLFNLACIVIAISGIVAVLIFIYPQVFTSLSDMAIQVGISIKGAFTISLNQPENTFISGLFLYLVILASALWGIDQFLRKRRYQHTTLCL